MSDETCGNCKYGRDVETAGGSVYCQRYPPTAILVVGEVRSFWPTANADSTCGEFCASPE